MDRIVNFQFELEQNIALGLDFVVSSCIYGRALCDLLLPVYDCKLRIFQTSSTLFCLFSIVDACFYSVADSVYTNVAAPNAAEPASGLHATLDIRNRTLHASLACHCSSKHSNLEWSLHRSSNLHMTGLSAFRFSRFNSPVYVLRLLDFAALDLLTHVQLARYLSPFGLTVHRWRRLL